MLRVLRADLKVLLSHSEGGNIMEKGQKADGKEMKAFFPFTVVSFSPFPLLRPTFMAKEKVSFFPLLLLPLRENEEAPFSSFALLFRSFRRASQAETRVSD